MYRRVFGQITSFCDGIILGVFFAELDAERSRSCLFLLGAWRASSDGRQAATPLLLLLHHVNSLPRRKLNDVFCCPESIFSETKPLSVASVLVRGPVMSCI